MVDRVFLRAASGAEVERGEADLDGSEPRHVPGARCLDLRHDGRARQDVLARVPALGADPALVRVDRGAVHECRLRAAAAFGFVDVEIGEREQARAGSDHELREVGRPLAAQGRHRLAQLERVSDRVAERLVHVGEKTDDVTAGARSELEHRLGQDLRVLKRLHEGAVADLHVQHDCLGSGSDLLGHDARRDQRDAVDGRRHVPERVQLLVRRDEVRGLTDDRHADVSNLRDELVQAQLDAEARNRLELVQRAAGVTEPASAHLPERNAARGDDRPDGDRRLVPDAPGRVLVDDASPELRRHVDGLAAADERLRHRERLGACQSTEHDRHAESGHLVIGDVPACVAEDQVAELVCAELASVPLALDQLRRVDRHGVTIGCPGIPRRGGLPPSQALTVAPTSPNSPSWIAPLA